MDLAKQIFIECHNSRLQTLPERLGVAKGLVATWERCSPATLFNAYCCAQALGADAVPVRVSTSEASFSSGSSSTQHISRRGKGGIVVDRLWAVDPNDHYLVKLRIDETDSGSNVTSRESRADRSAAASQRATRKASSNPGVGDVPS
jgi:hypothetical protein